jgi:tetratricopeptide (TPR) repeat protein
MTAILSRIRGWSTSQKPLRVLTSSRSDYILLALLTTLLVVNNARWLRVDNVPPGWDAAGYLINSLDALQAAKNPSLPTLASLYFQRLGPRPTFAFVALATPFYLLFGPTADVATLGTNSIFYALMVCGTYALGKNLFDRRVGLLSAFVVSVNPEITDLSTRYWPHFSVVAIATVGTYLLLRSDRLASKKHTLAFGALLGTGLLLRPAYPALFLFGPTLFVTIESLFSNVAARDTQAVQNRRRRITANLRSRIILGLLPALLIALCVAGPFYLTHSADILGKVSIKQDITQRAWMVDRQSPLWYLLNMPYNISWLLFALFVVGATLAFAMLALGKHRHSIGFLLFWLTSSYILASLPLSKDFFYFAPLYCPIAIVSIFWAFYVNDRRVQGLLVGLILVIGIFTLVVASWSMAPLRLPAVQHMIETLGMPTHPPQPEDWRIEEINGLLQEQESPSTPRRIGIVSDDYAFSFSSFAYYAKLQELDQELEYTSGFRPWSTLLDTDYVVVKAGRWPLGDRTAMQNARVLFQVLDNEGSAFYTTHVLIEDLSLPGRFHAQIYARVRPSSLQETLSIATELISLDPHNATAYLTRLDESVAEFQRAMADEPLSACEHTTLGDSFLQLGMFEEASSSYKQALRIDPGYAQAQLGLEVVAAIENTPQRRLADLLTLLGYRIDQLDVQAGEPVLITLWWQALRAIDRDYTLFMHLVGPDGRIWAQEDALLGYAGLRTSAWTVGRLVKGEYQLNLPADAPPGDYVLHAGVYYWESGERLPVWDEEGQRAPDDAVTLGKITVHGGNGTEP